MIALQDVRCRLKRDLSAVGKEDSVRRNKIVADIQGHAQHLSVVTRKVSTAKIMVHPANADLGEPGVAK